MAQFHHDFDQRKFQQLFGETSQPTFAYDVATLGFVDANAAAVELFGYTRRQMMAKRLSDVASPEDVELARRYLSPREPYAFGVIEVRARDRDGAVFGIEAITTPMTYAGRNARLVIVGEQRSAEELTLLYNSVAEETDRSKQFQQQIRRQESLTSFARPALAGLDPTDLPDAAARLVKESLAVDFSLCFELKEKEGALACVASAGVNGEASAVQYDPKGDSLAARALRAGAPVVGDPKAVYGGADPERFMERSGANSAIGLPIHWTDTCFGSIVACSRAERQFSEAEIHFLEKLPGVVAIAGDRTSTQTNAKTAAKRIRDVLETMVEHFIHVDRDWRISFVNLTVGELFSSPAQTLVGEPFASWFPSFNDPRIRPHYEAAMNQGTSASFEFVSKLNNHGYEARVYPTPEGVGVCFRDITSRRLGDVGRPDGEQRFRRLLSRMPAILYVSVDREMRIITHFGGGHVAIGIEPDELVGERLADIYGDQHALGEIVSAFEQSLAGESTRFEERFAGRHYLGYVEPGRDDAENVTSATCIALDVSERVSAEAQLAEAQSLAHLGTWSEDLLSDNRTYSDELQRIFGRSIEAPPLSSDEFLLTVPPDDAGPLKEAMARSSIDGRPWNVDHRIVRGDGSIRHVQNVDQCILGRRGKVVRMLGSILDITERRLAESELMRLANFDALTGLPNRTRAASLLAESIALASAANRHVAVYCLDIDNFKSINESFGHAAGDELLKAVSRRLMAVLRRGDIVGRVGANEFIIIFADVGSRADIDLLVKKVSDVFALPFETSGREQFISISAGISVFPEDGVEPEQLMRCADSAMYRAKEGGANKVVTFALDMHDAAVERLDLQNDLHRALGRQEFRAYYQPIVDASRRRLVGFEALLRWEHPTRGIISPDQFITLAEQTGLIVGIGAWVLRTACIQARAWNSVGGSPLRVSVNLSGRQFADAALVDMVSDVLRETGLPPNLLDLEITESSIVRDAEAGAAAVRSLNAMGVNIAIDDFGTGYSSLSQLRIFTVGTLKLDQSFVRGLPDNAGDASIARGIIALGHALGMTLTAEGVETEEQSAFLRDEGCDALQGYLISRPVPEIAVRDIISRFTHSSA